MASTPAEYTLADWQQKAAALVLESRAFIDGHYVNAIDGSTFDTINPFTGQSMASIARCQVKDVDLAVAAAQKSFTDGRWSGLAPRDRKAVLLKMADLIAAEAESFALLDSMDMGKPIMDALHVDVQGSVAVLRWYAELADKLYDSIAPTDQRAVAQITRAPVGVVAAVIPWNFPLDMAIWKIAPALLMGNSVILKPAEQSPLSAIRLAAIAKTAGLPDGVLNVLPGYGYEAGEALGRHPGVDCLTFTGSTEIGKRFLQYAGESNMKMVWLECGGKSPNLVFADCQSLAKAAHKSAWGIFFNQGQICSANSRLLVERTVHDDFVDLLVNEARQFVAGNPLSPATTLGTIVDGKQADRIQGYIDRAIAEGATLRHGGKRLTIDGCHHFIEPTILTNVTPDMTIAKEEVFGPVLAVMAFDSEPEAISIANDSIYGLAASVWTDNLHRAHRVARRLRAGTVSVNTVDALDPAIPFGGFGQSGFGRDLSIHALDKFTQLKTTWIQLED